MKPGDVAVVGAGWAGLAAAVALTEAGRRVTLLDTAGQPGGRARRVEHGELTLDNGQHILIGAYSATLALMRQLGVDLPAVLSRQPLTLRYPDGRGLQLPPGAALPAFVRGVAGASGWSWRDRAALLRAATGWLMRGFRCDPQLSVAQLCRRLPARVRTDLVDPLCIAALNTPADEASAAVFLRVLRDALFSGPGAADLLLPRAPLDALLPAPAVAWLARAGVEMRWRTRALELQTHASGWSIDGQPFAQLVLACSANEAARLARPHAPDWADRAAALRYEPIVTVYLQATGARLASPMMALDSGPDAPAQFIFDLGALGGTAGRFACAISGAAAWVDRGLPATGAAALQQVRRAFPDGTWPSAPTLLHTLAEKRATFRCTPALDRPAADIAGGLWAAGDYVQGPYPATLEGAVRAGQHAARSLLAE